MAALLAGSCLLSAAPAYVPATVSPPAVQREFRAAWVATVSNIDWPSKPGLPVEQQKAELTAILDKCAQLKLNAVILQVRPACDALYDSKIEPWSEYLTGEMGRAPQPYYDPLAFAVDEAHQRGLELHAWFNPYRARHPSGKSPISANHISKTNPGIVRKYGNYLWLDPADRAVQDLSLRVILDVVKRYDIDGAHMDDYFYPYRVKENGADVDFPDDATWKRYQAGGGKLSREDWRRESVNTFIKRLYDGIKAEKKWVKFGISPFGIWRPGNPPQIKGLDAYDALYADSRKWLVEGWLDYSAPQLYWAIDPPAQSYPVLLKWWAEQNPKGRHVWPGNNNGKVGDPWPASEIINQVQITRKEKGSTGNIHWNMSGLMRNKAGLADELARIYGQPALVPASPWLDKTPPGKPALRVEAAGSGVKAGWSAAKGEAVNWWVLQSRFGSAWRTEVLPGSRTSATFSNGTLPDAVAVMAVDRVGNASAVAGAQRK
ncbi:MAG: family 10 glycosylhydrolase [Verrucomicrobiota bacterium]